MPSGVKHRRLLLILNTGACLAPKRMNTTNNFVSGMCSNRQLATGKFSAIGNTGKWHRFIWSYLVYARCCSSSVFIAIHYSVLSYSQQLQSRDQTRLGVIQAIARQCRGSLRVWAAVQGTSTAGCTRCSTRSAPVWEQKQHLRALLQRPSYAWPRCFVGRCGDGWRVFKACRISAFSTVHYFVQAMHLVSTLVSDCRKLRGSFLRVSSLSKPCALCYTAAQPLSNPLVPSIWHSIWHVHILFNNWALINPFQ